MHKDRFSISTTGLPELPKEKSEKQELLKQGYRLFLEDGNWYAEKLGKRVNVS